MHKQDFKRWVTTALWEAYKPVTDQEAHDYYKSIALGESSLEAFVRIIHARTK